MTKVFVPNTMATKALLPVIREVEAAGYDKNQAFIGAEFIPFAQTLKKGDTAVVYSLTAFHSVTEILETLEQLNQWGVAFESIKEPWFHDPKTKPKELLIHLFRLAERLHAPAERRTQPRVARKTLRKNPKVLQVAGRAALAAELVDKQQMPVVEACRTAGCSVSAYYHHKKESQPIEKGYVAKNK